MSVHKKYDSLILELLLLSSFRKLGGECSVHQDIKNELEVFTRLVCRHAWEKSANTLRGIILTRMEGETTTYMTTRSVPAPTVPRQACPTH